MDFVVEKVVVMIVFECVIVVEFEIIKYDIVVGDGDCGIGFKCGVEGKLYNVVCLFCMIW